MIQRTSSGRDLLLAAAFSLTTVPVPAAVLAQELGLPIGTAAPAATLQDLDGNPVQLQEHTSKGPTLIEFWATWCGICTALEPQLDEIHARYGERMNVVVVAVGVAQTPRRVKQHVAAHDPGYPYFFDNRGAAVRAYNVPTTSVVVILDATGKVVYTGSGADQDLVEAARRVLGVSAPASPSG